jgi:hypothetical protein
MIGLVAALDHLCLELSRAGVSIAYTHDNVPSTLHSDDVVSVPYRSGSAAERDQVQQRQCSRCTCVMAPTDSLTIIDKGVGFDVDARLERGRWPRQHGRTPGGHWRVA